MGEIFSTPSLLQLPAIVPEAPAIEPQAPAIEPKAPTIEPDAPAIMPHTEDENIATSRPYRLCRLNKVQKMLPRVPNPISRLKHVMAPRPAVKEPLLAPRPTVKEPLQMAPRPMVKEPKSTRKPVKANEPKLLTSKIHVPNKNWLQQSRQTVEATQRWIVKTPEQLESVLRQSIYNQMTLDKWLYPPFVMVHDPFYINRVMETIQTMEIHEENSFESEMNPDEFFMTSSSPSMESFSSELSNTSNEVEKEEEKVDYKKRLFELLEVEDDE
jgi:hypothetical protein